MKTTKQQTKKPKRNKVRFKPSSSSSFKSSSDTHFSNRSKNPMVVVGESDSFYKGTHNCHDGVWVMKDERSANDGVSRQNLVQNLLLLVVLASSFRRPAHSSFTASSPSRVKHYARIIWGGWHEEQSRSFGVTKLLTKNMRTTWCSGTGLALLVETKRSLRAN